MSNKKTAYYVTVRGKAPRKRKVDHFERRLPDSVTSLLLMTQARELAKQIVADAKLREAKASVAPWSVSESEFVNSETGATETIVFRNIFPSGPAQAIDLN